MDEDLAETLKTILEESDKIDVAHIAQKTKDYNIEISEKIIQQIDSSDYLIAIITKNSIPSASVNQELGYAQGKQIPKIPMIEKNASEGIFVYARDKEEFSRDNFEDVCKIIRKQIEQLDTRKKPYTNEEVLIQKSAHFRYELNQCLDSFFIGLLLITEKDMENSLEIMLERNNKKQFQNEINLLVKDKKSFHNYMLQISIRKIKTIIITIEQFLIEINNLHRLPNQDLLSDEIDAWIKLQERCREIKLFGEDIFAQIKGIEKKIDRDTTFTNIIKENSTNDSLQRDFMIFSHLIRLVFKAVFNMYDVLEKTELDYGKIAFKDPNDDESV